VIFWVERWKKAKENREMSALKKAIWLLAVPFRVAWTVFLIAYVLVGSAVCLMVGAFVAYWVALTFSYIFLPEAWTEAMWVWGASLYAEHHWIKVATIAAFTLLLFPILAAWPGRDPLEEVLHEKKMNELNNNMIAARQQERAQAERQAA
jgi:hypothetical protein